MKFDGLGPWMVTIVVAGISFLFLKGTMRMLGFVAVAVLALLALTGKKIGG